MNAGTLDDIEGRLIGADPTEHACGGHIVGQHSDRRQAPRFDVGEVVRAAVRLLQTQLEEREAKLEALRKAVEVELAELDRGEGLSAEEVFEDLLDRLNRSEAA